MAIKLANNATSTLAGAISAAATSVSVVSGDASKFPTLAAGDWCPITVVDAAGNTEIMRCTARAGAVLTVIRGQEGTVAKAFAAGARIDVRATAAALEAFKAVASSADAGLMSAADKSKMDGIGAAADKTTAATVGAAIANTSTDTPADSDSLVALKAGGSTLFRLTWAGLKSLLKTYFDSLYATIATVDAKVAKAGDALTGGFTAAEIDDGTKASGTYTPTPTGGNFRKITNGGAFQIAAPTVAGCYDIVVTVANNAAAGIITFSGFLPGNPRGDALTVVNANTAKIHIQKTGIGCTAVVEAGQ